MPRSHLSSTAPARPANSYHHADLRRALIDTALAMVTEEGAWNFTLREVARRAGVSHAAPYNHFEDKSALLAEVAALGFQSLRDAMEAAARGAAALCPPGSRPRRGRRISVGGALALAAWTGFLRSAKEIAEQGTSKGPTGAVSLNEINESFDPG